MDEEEDRNKSSGWCGYISFIILNAAEIIWNLTCAWNPGTGKTHLPLSWYKPLDYHLTILPTSLKSYEYFTIDVYAWFVACCGLYRDLEIIFRKALLHTCFMWQKIWLSLGVCYALDGYFKYGLLGALIPTDE